MRRRCLKRRGKRCVKWSKGKSYKYKGKRFETGNAKKKFLSWNPIIRKAMRDGVPKSTLRMMRRFQKSWIGK